MQWSLRSSWFLSLCLFISALFISLKHTQFVVFTHRLVTNTEIYSERVFEKTTPLVCTMNQQLSFSRPLYSEFCGRMKRCGPKMSFVESKFLFLAKSSRDLFWSVLDIYLDLLLLSLLVSTSGFFSHMPFVAKMAPGKTTIHWRTSAAWFLVRTWCHEDSQCLVCVVLVSVAVQPLSVYKLL